MSLVTSTAFSYAGDTPVVRKTEKLEVRVLATDKRALERIACVEGEAMAVVLRKLIRDRARELGVFTAEQKGGEQYAEPAHA